MQSFPASAMNRNNLLFSVVFLSAAIIAFQLALIQILSNVQWYHFAYMVISIALLGFGAAGTFLAIFRTRLINRTDALLPFLMIGTSIVMSLVTDISQSSLVRFDSYLLFAEYTHIGRLLITYLLFIILFFLGALAIGLVFVKYVQDIGKIYFANLLGSGSGGLIALAIIWSFHPRQLPALIAILPLIGALIILPKKKLLHLSFGFIAIALISWKCFNPPQLVLSEYKDISKILLLPEAKITLTKSSPYGVIQTVHSPVLRFGPGMSLTAQRTAQIKMAVFMNGDWFGAVTDWDKTDTSFILDYTTCALPYIMAQRDDVLVLQSGAGIDVAHAVSRNAKKVVAVESNSIILSTLKKELAGETNSLFLQPPVTVHNMDPRTFLLTDTSRYDLITLAIVGTFGGSSGLHALQEQYLLTKETFRQMWRKLNARGVISVTSWMDYPVRNPLKILATMVEVLESFGLDPKTHIAAIRSWGTITFVMTRSPLQKPEINNIRHFGKQMMFDPAILPGLKTEERSAYNQFQDDHFFGYIEKIISPGRKEFYEDYDFNISPATDNKPYFSQYIKWRMLDRLAGFFGNRSVPFFEIGYLLVVVTLIQITLISLVLILLPLFKIGWKGNKMGIIFYFSGIGLGYMFVEMIFIQHFIFYFGNPVYAASAVITSLLIFSGFGSYHSVYFTARRNRLLKIFAMIIVLLLAYAFILTHVLQETIQLNLLFKLLIVFLLTAPLAFCMGIPFPVGLLHVARMNEGVVPWAWGINGCISVISAVLATMLAVELGLMWIMVMAAVGYGVAGWVAMRWR